MVARLLSLAVRSLSVLVLLLPLPGVAVDIPTIQYQGERIEIQVTAGDPNLQQSYSYVLPHKSVEKLEAVIRSLQFGPTFLGFQQLDSQFWNLRFPGYGTFHANQIRAKLDPKLDIMYVEIPEAGLNRYFVVELQQDGSLSVVDDFVADSAPEVTRVHRSTDGGLLYSNGNGDAIIPNRK